MTKNDTVTIIPRQSLGARSWRARVVRATPGPVRPGDQHSPVVHEGWIAVRPLDPHRGYTRETVIVRASVVYPEAS